MEKNVGTLDAVVRFIVGVGLLVLALMLAGRPFLALGTAVVGLLLIGTAAARACPLYAALGLSTRRGTAE
ncbi:MAG: DUF2892 domain-containing protein [Gemmatimonadetes bacterium]|nr:MAG: DUF2892 domain-containing protein [Gemmatimonadota bacterium]PYO68575.1 MAG: DUF2892 domain-containing protein [Gemmatimonadota bacterium]PYO82998.1 MAG: DUF2892 domain-containing protein [Gemmatimonadota bacterium]PYP64617.1 MAG: DUF2892 domain-containing protein [Gemmatimonadota bacterium]